MTLDRTHLYIFLLGRSRIANIRPRFPGARKPRQSDVKIPDMYSIIDDTNDSDTIPTTVPYYVHDTYYIIDDTNNIDTVIGTVPTGPLNDTSITHHNLISSNSHSGNKPSYSEVLRQ